MFDQAFHSTQTFGKREKPAVLQEPASRAEITKENGGHHSAEAAHLRGGQIMLRMRFEAGVNDAYDAGMALQPTGNLSRVFAVPLHTQVQRLDSAQSQEGVEWPANRPHRVL